MEEFNSWQGKERGGGAYCFSMSLALSRPPFLSLHTCCLSFSFLSQPVSTLLLLSLFSFSHLLFLHMKLSFVCSLSSSTFHFPFHSSTFSSPPPSSSSLPLSLAHLLCFGSGFGLHHYFDFPSGGETCARLRLSSRHLFCRLFVACFFTFLFPL